MKITVIGANSLIARNMILYLTEYAHISANDIYMYDFQPEQTDGYTRYGRIDVLSPESLQTINYDVDIVYIFTGKTGTLQAFDDPDEYIDINQKALLHILNAYRTSGSKAKIVFPSTRLVYKGNSEPLDEDAPKEAKTIYAASKLACEQYLQMYHEMYGVPYVVFRISVPYGSMIENASSYGTVEFMLNKARNGQSITLYGDGSLRRTITSMHDLCAQMYMGACTDTCVNDVYNIDGEDYSLREMAEGIADKYHVGVEYIPWPDAALKIESGHTVFDASKLRRLLGYRLTQTYEQNL